MSDPKKADTLWNDMEAWVNRLYTCASISRAFEFGRTTLLRSSCSRTPRNWKILDFSQFRLLRNHDSQDLGALWLLGDSSGRNRFILFLVPCSSTGGTLPIRAATSHVGLAVRVLSCSMSNFCTLTNAPPNRVGPLKGAWSKLAFWSSLIGGTELDKLSKLSLK